MHFCVADADGRIVRRGYIDGEDIGRQELAHGETIFAGASPDPDYCYMDAGVVRMRPDLGAVLSATEIRADGKAAAVLSCLPMPVTVLVDGVAHEVPDGSLELRSIMPADYRLEIRHWPHRDWSAVVRAR